MAAWKKLRHQREGLLPDEEWRHYKATYRRAFQTTGCLSEQEYRIRMRYLRQHPGEQSGPLATPQTMIPLAG
jgi:hypothetical protein